MALVRVASKFLWQTASAGRWISLRHLTESSTPIRTLIWQDSPWKIEQLGVIQNENMWTNKKAPVRQ